MRSIRLKNFRSLRDTERIELRPITLLVGANSSGKSSFLRFFPLLRQTVETPTESPLLWYTDTGYVDFGDFSQAVRRGAEPRAITVDFEIQAPALTEFFHDGTVGLSMNLQEQDGRTQVRECVITCIDDWCKLSFDNTNALTVFEINGFDMLRLDPSWRARLDGVHLVPELCLEFASDVEPASTLPDDGPGVGQLLVELRSLMQANASAEAIEGLMRTLRYGTSGRIKSELRSLQDSTAWKQFIDEIDYTANSFKLIRSILLAREITDILSVGRLLVDRYAKGIKYLGPFRIAPERFYRQQALAVHQIEPRGENLAMFLRALPEQQFQDLSRFVHEHFGFGLRMRTEGSHVSILIEEDNGEAFNLTDMGYGFSQVLPVVTQAWASARRFRPSGRELPTTMLVIEQPELHLHPHHQARLADMLAGVVNASRATSVQPGTGRAGEPSGVQVLVETHSEALINRLGELVEAGDFSADDVSVLLFEKDPGSGITTVRQSHFAADGTLTNWPVGFFAP